MLVLCLRFSTYHVSVGILLVGFYSRFILDLLEMQSDSPRLYLEKIKLLIPNTLNTVPFNQFALLLSADTASCVYSQELSGNQFDVKITEQDIAHHLLRHITKLEQTQDCRAW